MELSIQHNIKRQSHHVNGLSDEFKSLIIGGDSITNFQFDTVEIQDFKLTNANYAAFSLNLFDHIKFADANLVFIHAFYANCLASDNQTQFTPLKFQVSLGGTAIGNMSQFQMSNIDSYNGGAILLDNFSDPGTTLNGILFVIAGGTL